MQSRMTAILLAAGLATTTLALAEAAAPNCLPDSADSRSASMMGPMGERSEGQGHGPLRGKHRRGEKPESFTEESVRKMGDGRVVKRQIEQKVGEGSFSRKEVVTNPDGKTMSRTMSAILDKDKKTWTRKLDVVEFDGSTWSGSREVPAMHGPDGDDDVAAQGPVRHPARSERPRQAR